MRQYDIAFSFAGEQRPYVARVAAALRKTGVRLFYDDFERTRLWGRDLIAELDRIYRKESRCVVMFISTAYRDKTWTRHEFRSTLSAALNQHEEYVLPVRFDDTDLDGLAPSVAYVDANSVKPAELARMLLEKLDVLVPRPQTSLNIWRIVSSRYATTPFSSHGAATFGGRWNQTGTQTVYAASSLCVAALEIAVTNPSSAPRHDFVAIGAKILLSKSATELSPRELPIDWDSWPPRGATQIIGTNWVDSMQSAVLSLPSVVLPAERIFLLNPKHDDFKSLSIFSEEPFSPQRLVSLWT